MDGLYGEALALETPGILDWAQDLLQDGKCLTAADSRYPARWLERLKDGAPPAMWLCGPAPERRGSVSIVGSRQIDRRVADFAREVGVQVAKTGLTLVSGNAIGCDFAGMKGAISAGGSVIGILPHGTGLLGRRLEGVSYLSACPPTDEFTRASAMERNVLIYAASSHSVVAQCRFREGGTWNGAVDAQRRKLTHLVARNSSEPGLAALIALGAIPIDRPEDLPVALEVTSSQVSLFG
jgi:predicted Rossmann fold nucleotide-binding protein DprA/Smf involved in DNA uptake